MREFDCPDCGYHVNSFVHEPNGPAPERCVCCQWLRDKVTDEAERERLRRFLSPPAPAETSR